MNPKTKLALLASMAALGNHEPERSDPLEGIDIEKEVELINQKKSKLSARLRKLVMQRHYYDQYGGLNKS